VTGVRPLQLIRSLFDELNDSTISYCHWKSNFNLDRTLTGEADIDLLVDTADRTEFEALAAGLRFVRLVHSGPKHIPGIEDYIGLDEGTGTLVHLHLHYALVMGEQRVKNHHLPLEQWLLGRAQLRDGVRVPRREDELLFLYIRSLVKSDTQACVRASLRKAPHPFPASIHAELLWFAGQVSDDEVLEACRSAGLGSMTDGLADYLRRLRTGKLTPGFVWAQKRAVLRHLRPYRRFPGVVCAARKVWLRVRYSKPARYVTPLPRKRLPDRGLYVVIAGADGCGKTTLARDLPKWLGSKLQSSTVYFGQPKNSRALPALRKIRRLFLALSRRSDRGALRPLSRLFADGGQLVNSALWIHVARHRTRFDARARERVARGQVVFAERFPVRAFWDMDVPMDGPRLRPDATEGAVLRRLATRERSLYETIDTPDCVIVLDATLATLRARKPETPADEHRAKALAVSALASTGAHDVIDAERPYDEVLREAKRVVWRFISPPAPARRATRSAGRSASAVHV
jgi:thymidylate kinase